MDKYNQYRSKANDTFNNMPLGMGLPFLSVDELRAYNHPTLANAAEAVQKFLDPKGATETANTNNSYVNNWEPKHIQQQAIMNLAQVQPQQAQQPRSPLQDIIAKANSGNTQGAIESARIYDKTQQPQNPLQNIQAQAIQQATQAYQSNQPQQSQQYTPLPKQMTGNQIDQMYKSGQHWTPEQEQALNIYTRVQNKKIQDPYKEGSMAYVINNLQGHGYNPQQIADYMQAQSKGTQQPQQPQYQNPYLSNLNSRLKDLSSEIYVARNSFDSERADMLQKQYDQLLGTALQQGQQGITNAQYGKLTEADKAKLESEKELRLIKNQGLSTVAGLKADSGKGSSGKGSKEDNGKTMLSKQTSDIMENVDVINNLSRIAKIYSDPQYAFLFGTNGLIKRAMSDKTLQNDPNVNQYNNMIEPIRRSMAKKIEGSRMTDRDWDFYNRVLMNPNASQQDFMNSVNSTINTRKSEHNNNLAMLKQAGYNSTNFHGYGNANDILNGKAPQTTQPTSQQNAQIPQGAIQKLKSNPQLAGDFDAKYGQGASAKILGGN